MLLLTLALLLTVTVIITVTAKGSSEATLRVESYGSAPTEKTGKFDELLAELADVAPTVSTTYTLTLNADATHTQGVRIGGSDAALAKIKIDLNGFTLTANTEEPLFYIDGELDGFELDGNFNSSAKRGRIEASVYGSPVVFVAENLQQDVDIKITNADIVCSKIAAGGSVIYCGDGRVTVENTNITITYSGSDNSSDARSIIHVGASTLGIKNSALYNTANDGAQVRGIYASSPSSQVYVDNTEISAAYAVYSSVSGYTDENVQSLLLVNSRLYGNTNAIYTDNAYTTVTLVGGGIDVASGKSVVGGEVSSQNTSLWFGNGGCTVGGGVSPSTFASVQENCAFSQGTGGVYTLIYNGTEEAMYTVSSLSSSPAVLVGSFDTLVQNLNTTSLLPTEEASYILTLLKDASSSKAITISTNPYCNVLIDYNGYDLTMSTSSHIFTYRGNFHFSIDGADITGERISTLTGSTSAQTQYLVYPKVDSTNGIYNDETVTRISSLKFVHSRLNSTATNRRFFCLCAGDTFMYNVSMEYSGTSSSAPTGNTANPIKFITVGWSAPHTPDALLYMKDCIMNDSATKDSYTVGIEAQYEAHVFLDTVSIYADTEIAKGEEATVTAINCNFIDNGTADTEATVTMPSVFASGMVLQRQMPITVYGFCDTDGVSLKATLKKGDTLIASAQNTVENGEFSITLPSQEAAKGLTLTLEQVGIENAAPKVYTDVNIGEVWIVSGQSNSDTVRASQLEDMEEYYLNADNFGSIRVYTQNASRAAYENEIGKATWKELDKSSMGSVAATAYVAAVKLAAELGEDVPVAIVHAAHSSSKIASWISYEEMQKLNLEATDKQALSDEWNYVYTRSALDLRYADGFRLYFDTYGKLPTDGNTTDQNNFRTLTGLKYSRPDKCSAGACYNAMLAHMTGYAARGVIWYQGEGDLGDNIETYPMFFDAMRETFEYTFQNDSLAFIVMQIAPYGESDANGSTDKENKTTRFKAIQYKMCEERENVYLVSTATSGSNFTWSDLIQGIGPSFIHPVCKSPIGLRIANVMLTKVYGFTHIDGSATTVEAPRALSAKRVGNTVVITFNSDLYTFFGKGALGFELSDLDNYDSEGDAYNTKEESSWYKVEGTIVGNTVVLEIPEGKNPKGVRYAHGNPYVELRDGTLIEFNYNDDFPAVGDFRNNEIYASITDRITGEQYTFYPYEGDSIRMLSYGNITNESGEPMPLFKLDITD